VLHGIVRVYLATFLAHTERSYAAPLPKYGVDTFEGYLACGDVAAGLLRCHCGACGHDVHVAFSCKHPEAGRDLVEQPPWWTVPADVSKVQLGRTAPAGDHPARAAWVLALPTAP
jgi:hypothetical protein